MTTLAPETDITDEDMERLRAFAESRTNPDSSTYYTPTPVRDLVVNLKANDQDHEFYPTTDAIIQAMARDIGLEDKNDHGHRMRGTDKTSVLDIGAGNGKVLRALRDKCGLTQLHAIEKSPILCRELDASILIVGTEFHEQSLFSKQVDVITCNPPYSQFEEWSEKIIRQAASKVVYLIIPQRWEKSVRIKDALKFRGVLMPGEQDRETDPEVRRWVKANRVKIVGNFDFEDAEDRQARAKVHLLRIDLPEAKDDAFERFFNEQFADLIGKFEAKDKPKADAEEKKDEHGFGALVVGPNYPEALVALYNQEMAHIQKNYQLVAQLDADLLKEFDVTPKRIMECLKARLSGLKNTYWQELFSHLKAITDRLTSGSRKSLLGTLQKHVEVDFTVPNILEVVVWVIKNANNYIESQLLDTYEHMVDKCNVQMYKSNKRVWVDGRWRSRDEADPNSHYALDYRIVTHRIGGISGRYSSSNGLAESANNFLGDLMTIARNLGYNCATGDRRLDNWSRSMTWISGDKQEFFFLNKGKAELLFDVRAFGNGNLHLRLNKSFILALNVEHGRLKGWLNTPQEAAEELQDPEAVKHFKTNVQLLADSGVLLLN